MIGTLFRRVRDIHFVGIGGVGMSGIAEILLALDFRVSGSDVRGSEALRRLEELGAKIWIGHHKNHLENAEVVVYSSAVPWDNPELAEARARRIPVIPRAEMLAELMRMQTSVAVAGMHGKTTTTSMIAWLLSHAGLDPTVVIGGKLDALGGGARVGEGKLLVAEADESDKSFLRLFPTIAIVTNLDFEHVDAYASMKDVAAAFLEFINRIPFYGYAIVCLDDPEVRKILPDIKKRVITYGLAPEATFRAGKPQAEGAASRFTLHKEARELGDVLLPMPGIHNVVNSLAVAAVADLFEIPFQATKAALESFAGVNRRFTVRGTAAGVTVIDDYGHHPTEIRAVLQAARQIAPQRIVVLFQPHRYTRTKGLFEEFLTCFHGADLLYVMDIYPASEQPIEGVTGQGLSEGIHRRGHQAVRFVGQGDHVAAEVARDLEPGDMLITLGAGNVTAIGPLILDQLRKKEGSRA
jgi:UDP-N-acetylmuramate--alanine ligase